MMPTASLLVYCVDREGNIISDSISFHRAVQNRTEKVGSVQLRFKCKRVECDTHISCQPTLVAKPSLSTPPR